MFSHQPTCACATAESQRLLDQTAMGIQDDAQRLAVRGRGGSGRAQMLMHDHAQIGLAGGHEAAVRELTHAQVDHVRPQAVELLGRARPRSLRPDRCVVCRAWPLPPLRRSRVPPWAWPDPLRACRCRLRSAARCAARGRSPAGAPAAPPGEAGYGMPVPGQLLSATLGCGTSAFRVRGRNGAGPG